jgi:hypothetical protein
LRLGVGENEIFIFINYFYINWFVKINKKKFRKNNFHYLAIAIPIEDHRWRLVEDQEGKSHLLDLNPIELEQEPQPSYDPFTDIVYHLFTRRNPLQSQILDTFNMDTVRNSNWNPNNGVRFIIHGYNGHVDTRENPIITEAFLTYADHNVVGNINEYI